MAVIFVYLSVIDLTIDKIMILFVCNVYIVSNINNEAISYFPENTLRKMVLLIQYQHSHRFYVGTT